MDLLIRSTPYPPLDRIPVYRPGVQCATGGFTLDLTGLPVGTYLPTGTALSVNEVTRIAKVIKAATVYANVGNADVTLNVAKGQIFQLGDIIAGVLNGKASTITGINTVASPLFDTITIDVTLGVAIAAGAGLFQAAAVTANAAVEYAGITGLLKNDKIIDTHNNVVDSVIGATAYANRIPILIPGLQAKLTHIIFSLSK